MTSTVMPCKFCGQKLRVPNDRGMLLVRCPTCTGQFDYVGSSGAIVPVAGGNVVNLEARRHNAAPVVPQSAPLAASDFDKFGQMRPRADAPASALTVVLPFTCSENGRPFSVTMAKEHLGEPFHVKSLEPAEDYRGLMQRGGYQVQAKPGALLDLADADWTGFQCFHCGAGECVGDRYDWLRCNTCTTVYCGSRVESIHGGTEKTRCPVCERWFIVGNTPAQSLAGAFYLVDKPGGNARPALTDNRAAAAAPGLFTRLTKLLA